MSRKLCLLCGGCGIVHQPPCYWDPTRKWDGILHNPPPPCRCKIPKCTECGGTGERATTPVPVEYVAARMTLLHDAGQRFFVMLHADGNLWTVAVEYASKGEPTKLVPFECLVQIASPQGPRHLLIPGSTWELFYPMRVGSMTIL